MPPKKRRARAVRQESTSTSSSSSTSSSNGSTSSSSSDNDDDGSRSNTMSNHAENAVDLPLPRSGDDDDALGNMSSAHRQRSNYNHHHHHHHHQDGNDDDEGVGSNNAGAGGGTVFSPAVNAAAAAAAAPSCSIPDSWLTDDEWKSLHRLIFPEQQRLADFRRLAVEDRLASAFKKPELQKIGRGLDVILSQRGFFSLKFSPNFSALTKATVASQITAKITDRKKCASCAATAGSTSRNAGDTPVMANSNFVAGKSRDGAGAAAATPGSAGGPVRRARERDNEEDLMAIAARNSEAGRREPSEQGLRAAFLDGTNNNNNNSGSDGSGSSLQRRRHVILPAVAAAAVAPSENDSGNDERNVALDRNNHHNQQQQQRQQQHGDGSESEGQVRHSPRRTRSSTTTAVTTTAAAAAAAAIATEVTTSGGGVKVPPVPFGSAASPRSKPAPKAAAAATASAASHKNSHSGNSNSSMLLGENSLNLMLSGLVPAAASPSSSSFASSSSSLSGNTSSIAMAAFDKYRSPLMEFSRVLARFYIKVGDSAGEFALPAHLCTVFSSNHSNNGLADSKERVVLLPVLSGSFEPSRWPVPPKEMLQIKINGQRVVPDYKKNWPETRSGTEIQRSYLPVDITHQLITKNTPPHQQLVKFENRGEANRYTTDVICCLVRMVEPRVAVSRFLQAIARDPRAEDRMASQLYRQYAQALTADNGNDDDEVVQVVPGSIGTAAAAAAAVGVVAAAGNDSSSSNNNSDMLLLKASSSSAAAKLVLPKVIQEINTTCVISRTRINVPVRSSFCQHLQCVDLMCYVVSQHVMCFFNCPVCDRPMRMQDIVIDPLIEALLVATAANSNTDSNSHMVAKPATYTLAFANHDSGSNNNTNNVSCENAVSKRCGINAFWATMRSSKHELASSDDSSGDEDYDDGPPAGSHNAKAIALSRGKALQSQRPSQRPQQPQQTHPVQSQQMVFTLGSATSMASTQPKRNDAVDVDNDVIIASAPRNPNRNPPPTALLHAANQNRGFLNTNSASNNSSSFSNTSFSNKVFGAAASTASAFRPRQQQHQQTLLSAGNIISNNNHNDNGNNGAGALLHTANRNSSSTATLASGMGAKTNSSSPGVAGFGNAKKQSNVLSLVGNSKDDAICID